jgi:lantibiotic transport system ATP-binding protein
MYTVATNQLTHHFSASEKVLNDVHLQVPQGSIYGFLGPNGAGKTTTLKLVLGLLKRQQGSIEIFGKAFEKNRNTILKDIGSLIESPSLYGHLTATENLLVWQKIYQCPKSRIAEVLKIVDLQNTGKKRAGKFSLGMKQRLSIAIALLHDPQLLILDEPTNGLDPNGIIEMRELLIQLNKEQGKTIIISSHLLSEIEKMVNHLGIINKGSILFQGTLQDLQSMQTQSSHILLHTSNNTATNTILNTMQLTGKIDSSGISLQLIDHATIAQLVKRLVENQIDVYQVATIKNDLETIFIDLVKN